MADKRISQLSATFFPPLTGAFPIAFNNSTYKISLSTVLDNAGNFLRIRNGQFLPLSGGNVDYLTINNGLTAGILAAPSSTLYVETSAVGINTETPLYELHVVGDVFSSGIISTNTGDSNKWTSSFSTVQTASANWNAVVFESSKWNSVFTTVRSNSADWKLEDVLVACSDETTELTTGVATTFRAPFGLALTTIRASVNSAPTGSSIIINVLNNNSSILSTPLSIDANEETSLTANVPVVISNPIIQDNSKVSIVITQVGSTFKGAGLKLDFKGYRI
jgi:hypothetical protein